MHGDALQSGREKQTKMVRFCKQTKSNGTITQNETDQFFEKINY